MADQTTEQADQKPIKRFTSYQEYLKEFYPTSTEREDQQKAEGDGEFGIELALDSLNRHAAILRFGDV